MLYLTSILEEVPYGYRQSGDGGVGFGFYTKQPGLPLLKKKQTCIVNISNTDLSDDIGDEGKRGYYYKSVFETCSVSGLKQFKDFMVFTALFPKTAKHFTWQESLPLKPLKKM